MNKLPKIFIYPGKLYATKFDYSLTTILGSCVAVCLWDKELRIGGMNHFMLPLWNGQGLASPKYGNIAIEKLINKMKYLGSKEENLIAKVFGGGRIIDTTYEVESIGDRNVEIAFDILEKHGIKVVKHSTGGYRGRKLMMLTGSFDIYHKFIEKSTK